ncbi:MAG: DUF1343 domain-containing protein [Chitinivibrionales bacterium]|nr:DUF1343 domain-containing protein [Chitinivibrionales bacterium]MBD3357551.1 DUF1343 domain-containing protein [Chitinivibrionales bacterium]
MTRFGLDEFLEHFPRALHGKELGVLCHAASVTSSYAHITEALWKHPDCRLKAVLGPQHGLFGQTQDNMVEWKGYRHPRYDIPVYSLYGETRKPRACMLEGLDALVIDLQDVGARPYTYIWTVKLCLEACAELSVPVWLLDRPNPIGALAFDGPPLEEEFHSFVGGAPIPLCHRMTMGEMARLIRDLYVPDVQLTVVPMKEWWRDSLWCETGLPWVLPSPNMPTPDTALVYPGMVLLEATNLSEGRGTTRPFELFGAPYIDSDLFRDALYDGGFSGCIFREHHFIPAFQKWAGEYCHGMQVHVTAPRLFAPVRTAAIIIAAAKAASQGRFAFNDPPYEYETEKMPFDILSGGSILRENLEADGEWKKLFEKWAAYHTEFGKVLNDYALYPERLP